MDRRKITLFKLYNAICVKIFFINFLKSKNKGSQQCCLQGTQPESSALSGDYYLTLKLWVRTVLGNSIPWKEQKCNMIWSTPLFHCKTAILYTRTDLLFSFSLFFFLQGGGGGWGWGGGTWPLP